MQGVPGRVTLSRPRVMPCAPMRTARVVRSSKFILAHVILVVPSYSHAVPWRLVLTAAGKNKHAQSCSGLRGMP